MNTTNLNILFVDNLPKFAHLLTIERQTKKQFLQNVADEMKQQPQNSLFFQSCVRSTFDTIRLSEDKNTVLFNQ